MFSVLHQSQAALCANRQTAHAIAVNIFSKMLQAPVIAPETTPKFETGTSAAIALRAVLAMHWGVREKTVDSIVWFEVNPTLPQVKSSLTTSQRKNCYKLWT